MELQLALRELKLALRELKLALRELKFYNVYILQIHVMYSQQI
jgi:hypothetical protein